MRQWDPLMRVLVSAVLIVGAIVALRSTEDHMRLAISELAAIPLLFALYIGATGLQDLFGSKKTDGDEG